jgi:hypothetical protein
VTIELSKIILHGGLDRLGQMRGSPDSMKKLVTAGQKGGEGGAAQLEQPLTFPFVDGHGEVSSCQYCSIVLNLKELCLVEWFKDTLRS